MRMKRDVIYVAVTLVFLLGVLTAGAAAEAPGLARITDPQLKAQYEELIAGAIREGGVVFYDTIITPETFDKLARGFKEYWGLPANFRTEYTNYTTSQFTTKVNEEITADRVSFDVGGVAAIPWLYDLHRNKDEVMEYASPVYDEYTKILDLKLGVRDYFLSNVFYFIPMWNPLYVTKEIKGYRDLLGPELHGLIIQGDAGNSESYSMVYLGLKNVLPPEVFEEFAALRPAAKVKSQDIAQDLVTGEYHAAWSGMPTRAYQFHLLGVDLEFVFPEEGTVFIPQSVFIPKRAPHPNAAKLFFDYFLSEEGQVQYVLGEAVSSGRDNFESPLPTFAPSIDTITAVEIDWSTISVEDLTAARAEWNRLFGGN